MNIIDPILFQARYQPGAPALCVLGKHVVSYAVLRSQMNNVARRAIACGLKQGSIVALSIDEPLQEAALILGLTQIGVITVSVGMLPPAELKIDAVIGATKQPFAPAAQHLPLDDSWIAGDGAPVETTPDARPQDDQVCRIVLTSGTTGDPKAVALTHNQGMTRNARFECSDLAFPPCRTSTWASALRARSATISCSLSLARRHHLFSRREHRKRVTHVRSISGRGHAGVAGCARPAGHDL